MSDSGYTEQLIAIARESAWFMEALVAVRSLGLASWCIGAGAVRNLVWDSLHRKSKPSPLPDVDVAYFDSEHLGQERDTELQAQLTQILPSIPWEVTNQASVHFWFENYFGYPVEPLGSLEEAVGTWPEYATSVGVRLEADNTITVISPHGLDDLFLCIVRRNPTRVSVASYCQRVTQKRYADHWPKVTIVPC